LLSYLKKKITVVQINVDSWPPTKTDAEVLVRRKGPNIAHRQVGSDEKDENEKKKYVCSPQIALLNKSSLFNFPKVAPRGP
jgi:hypothetical protein